jgi:copper homeostasis protein (lipoprotein)
MADTATPAASATPLEGTQWHLVEIGGQPSPPGADSARQPGLTLLAEGRKVQGSAGCNRMMGTYELDGAKLKFGPMATTRMACPAMATETAFLKALDATTRYELSGTSLTLFGGDTAVARLEAAKPN